MRKLKNKTTRDLISTTIPVSITKNLIDAYRVKLFAQIKDSFEKKKQSIYKEQIELKEWLDKKNSINILNPINNSWFRPFLRA